MISSSELLFGMAAMTCPGLPSQQAAEFTDAQAKTALLLQVLCLAFLRISYSLIATPSNRR